MLRAIELLDYLRSSGVIPDTFEGYVNEFADDSLDDAVCVIITPGMPPSEWTPLIRPAFQVLVRGSREHGPYAEAVANAIQKYMHQRTNFYLGTPQIGDDYYLGTGYVLDQKPTLVRQCLADDSAPIYLGRDEDRERPVYSLNFTCVMLQGE